MKTIKIDDATHRLLKILAAKREMTMFDFSAVVVSEANVKVPAKVLDAFIESQMAGKAGSVKEDKNWYDEQIARAEAEYPDKNELIGFLATEAGIE